MGAISRVSGSSPLPIAIATPSGRQKVFFEKALDQYHLKEAAVDGLLTFEEVSAAGLDFGDLTRAASTAGRFLAVDDYLDLVHLGGGYSIPKERLLDPTQSGDYLVFAPKTLHASLAPLCAHRAIDGRNPVMIDPEDVYALYKARGPDILARYLKDAGAVWTAPKPRFVLLVGAPDGAEGHESSMDQYYLTDARLGDKLMVGRLPFEDEGDIARYINGVLDNEARVAPGLWQLSATIVDGDPYWGNFAAKWIDRFTDWELSAGAPNDRMMHRYSQNPLASKRNGTLTAEKRNALLVSYTGHGGSSVFSDFGTIVDGQAKPLIVSAACADAAGGGRSSAARALANGSAIATIAAVVDTHPVPNVLLSEAIAKRTLGGAQTAGEMFHDAQADMRKKRSSLLAKVVLVGYTLARAGLAVWGFLLGLFGKKLELDVAYPSIAKMAKEHAELYTLLGDPAARLRQPLTLDKLHIPTELISGKTLRISGTLPDALSDGTEAILQIETLDAHDAEIIARIRIPVKAGALQPFTLPALPEGSYRVRVIAANEQELGATTRECVVRGSSAGRLDRSL